MKIVYVTESFLPDVNGVAGTAARVASELAAAGHQPLVIAPEPARGIAKPDKALGYAVERVPSIALPLYRGFRVGLPTARVRDVIKTHGAEVVHLAGPVVLGAAARHLDLPVVAVYATDMAAYARYYRLGPLGEAVAWRYLRWIHNSAARTLAPSTATGTQLRAHGFDRVFVWGRGVDTARFDPAKRDSALRGRLAPDGEVLVGYVGRLAPEKRLDLLEQVARLPGARLVIVGAGPADAATRRALPGAVFLGQRCGEELARLYASLDVFVHPGPHETFGNTLQEAAASGVPVVAPAAGGPLDLVRDGLTGFLVPPGEAGPLAAAVFRLAADAVLRARQGRAARLDVLDRSWPARCTELVAHYDAVLGRLAPAPAAPEPAVPEPAAPEPAGLVAA